MVPQPLPQPNTESLLPGIVKLRYNNLPIKIRIRVSAIGCPNWAASQRKHYFGIAGKGVIICGYASRSDRIET